MVGLDPGIGEALSEEPENCRRRDSRFLNARDSTHDLMVDRDPIHSHWLVVGHGNPLMQVIWTSPTRLGRLCRSSSSRACEAHCWGWSCCSRAARIRRVRFRVCCACRSRAGRCFGRRERGLGPVRGTAIRLMSGSGRRCRRSSSGLRCGRVCGVVLRSMSSASVGGSSARRSCSRRRAGATWCSGSRPGPASSPDRRCRCRSRGRRGSTSSRSWWTRTNATRTGSPGSGFGQSSVASRVGIMRWRWTAGLCVRLSASRSPIWSQA